MRAKKKKLHYEKRKKSKTDKKLIKNINFLIKCECMLKKTVSNSRNHCDNFKSKNQIFKKQ